MRQVFFYQLTPHTVTQAAAGLSQEKLEEYKSIFSFFDRYLKTNLFYPSLKGTYRFISSVGNSITLVLSFYSRSGGGAISTLELGQVVMRNQQKLFFCCCIFLDPFQFRAFDTDNVLLIQLYSLHTMYFSAFSPFRWCEPLDGAHQTWSCRWRIWICSWKLQKYRNT